MKKFTLIVVFVTIMIPVVFSQSHYDVGEVKGDTANYPYWIEMMQDPDVNVYKTVEAFEKYWENRPDRKGSGYNPFKRWEWYIRHKINPDGSRIAADHDLKAYKAYLESHQSMNKSSGNWENIGPVSLPDSPNPYWGNGRINAIAFHPTDPDIVFAGAPSGGLWKTTDGGQNWVPLSDGLSTLGVSSIIIDYNDPDVIYIGTGDRDNAAAEGLGVYKSIDGGENWVESSNGMGLYTVGRMVQHPTSSEIIFAATSSGIYKTIDGGQNWVQKKGGYCKDILFKPNNASVMYAVVQNRFFYRSTDDGESWQNITSGLPSVTNRSVIAISPDQPDYVYFLTARSNEFNGLYRSVDGGSTFELRSDSPNIFGPDCDGGEGGQPWYDLDIAVDPLDAAIIYAGGINCWKSLNGGQTWAMISNQVGECGAYPVHADLHVLEYNPVDGKLYMGNDGGVWWTDDGGDTWNRIVNGLAIGQQYKLGQSKLIGNHVSAGFQDNGISTFHSNTWIQSDMYADGMETAMDIADTTLGYGCAQFGWLVRRENDIYIKIIGGEGIGGITELGDWVTPFCQHETNPEVMFIGYQNLWRTNNLLDEDPSWTKISDGTGMILVVEHSPADEMVFYFSTYGKLYRSDNIGDEAPAFSDLSDQLPFGLITDIEAHPWNQDVVYITGSNRVFKSEDKGLNWEDISGTLPDVNINDIAYYNRNNIEGLYIATNIGVFFKNEFMDDWVYFSDGLPAAILATEVEIFHHADDPAMDRVRISTYGRGLWGSIPFHYQPVADFESSDTQIPSGNAIDFYDRSEGYPQSWSWTFEGGTPSTSSAANPTDIIYYEEGVFEVSLTVTNSEGTDTKTVTGYITVDDNITNMEDILINNIRVYPNPVIDILTFSTEEIKSIEIYDMMGAMVIRHNDNRVDLSNLNPGIYFVIGFDQNNSSIFKGKIIKN